MNQEYPKMDIYWENSNSWDYKFLKSTDRIKNFITFLKLIDENEN